MVLGTGHVTDRTEEQINLVVLQKQLIQLTDNADHQMADHLLMFQQQDYVV